MRYKCMSDRCVAMSCLRYREEILTPPREPPGHTAYHRPPTAKPAPNTTPVVGSTVAPNLDFNRLGRLALSCRCKPSKRTTRRAIALDACTFRCRVFRHARGVPSDPLRSAFLMPRSSRKRRYPHEAAPTLRARWLTGDSLRRFRLGGHACIERTQRPLRIWIGADSLSRAASRRHSADLPPQ